MITGQARVMQRKNRAPVMVLDRHGKARWSEVWNGNPRIVKHIRTGKPVQTIVNGPGVRPYIVAKTDERWTWREFRPPRGEIYFTQHETTFGQLHAGRVVLEPHIKARASPNKDWGWRRWNKLAWILQKSGFKVTQLGPLDTPILDGGIEHIITPSFRHAAAVLANARAAVLHEGGMHHAAVAVGLPAVVIFGGFISPEVTGYGQQVNLFTGEGLGCGMRVPCAHCADAMAAIKPEVVADHLMEILMREKVSA